MALSLRVAVFKTAGAVLEVLPERLDVALGRRLGAWLGGRSAKRAVLAENLRRVLGAPDVAVSDDLLDRFVQRGFENYGQYWAEGAKLPGLKPSVIAERFVIGEGREYLDAAFAAGNGVVVALPHIGSWEWGGSYLGMEGMPMTAVAEELSPPALFAWFKKKREAIGITIEPLNASAGSKLLQVLKDGGVVGLVCDRDLQGNGVEVDFFGARVTMPPGPATLALRTGAALVVAVCYTGPGRDHYAVISPPIVAEREGRLRDDVTRVTQLVTTELEGFIRRAPEQWHVLEPRFQSS